MCNLISLDSLSFRLTKHLEENGAKPEDIEKFKTRMSNAVKFLLPKFDDLQFFIGMF